MMGSSPAFNARHFTPTTPSFIETQFNQQRGLLNLDNFGTAAIGHQETIQEEEHDATQLEETDHPNA